MEKQEVRKTDLFTQYAFAVVDECIKDSQLNLATSDTTKIGVIWATGIGGVQTFEDEMFSFFQNGKVPESTRFSLQNDSQYCLRAISIKYGLHGPSYTVASACTSSNNAIADAFNFIRWARQMLSWLEVQRLPLQKQLSVVLMQ